jgi:capsular exopolysaccharide synthesis family protein
MKPCSRLKKKYEALQQAEKEFLKLKTQTAVHPVEKYWLSPQAKAPAISSANGWHELLNRLLSRYPQKPVRTLLVTGTSYGVGVTSSVVKFAQSMAKANNRKVLVVDANLKTPSLHQRYHFDPGGGVSDLLVDKSTNVFNFKRVGRKKMYLFACGRQYEDGKCSFDSRRFDTFLSFAREKFDYTVLDSAPITSFSETQVICSKVDGVLLVLEAGKTRRHVAIRAKKELEEAGGKLLGVVLNKRRYYIPERVYKRL